MSSCGKSPQTSSDLDIIASMKDYYGKEVKTKDSCVTGVNALTFAPEVRKSVREAFSDVHEEVTVRYYGCGPAIPEAIEGCSILDLGSGSGRDCFALSKLVGPSGHVVGLDMTQEQLEFARGYIDYHTQKFGYSQPNVEFICGYIEKLVEAGLQQGSVDIIIFFRNMVAEVMVDNDDGRAFHSLGAAFLKALAPVRLLFVSSTAGRQKRNWEAERRRRDGCSNCVVNLSPDKQAVLKEAHAVLKDGGELYFSDMYTDIKQTDEMKQDKVLWGEGIGGALMWDELYQLASDIGFSSPRLVTAKPVDTSQFSGRIGSAKYVAVTYRLFKLPAQGASGPCRVSYKGDIPGCQERLKLDDVTLFEKNEDKVVDSELATILTTSRFKQFFNITNALDATPETKDPKVNPFELLDRRCDTTCERGVCAP